MSLKYDCLGLPLDCLPIIFPFKMFVTKSLCLNECPISFTFFFIITVIMFLSSPIYCKMTSFLFSSVHLVLVVFLQTHVSIASNLSFSYFLRVHVSQTYNKTLQKYDLIKLFLVWMLKFLSVNKDVFFSNDCYAKAILLLTFFIDLLSTRFRQNELGFTNSKMFKKI